MIIASLEYIEKSKEDIKGTFFDSLGDLSRKIAQSNIKNGEIDSIYEAILVHFFKYITTSDKEKSNEYILGLNQIVDSNLVLGGVSNEIIEYVISLGKFGQNLQTRKYCVFFSGCVSRLLNKIDDNIYNRLLLLCEDSERPVRYEIAYNMRFFVELLGKDKQYEKIGSLIKIIKVYFTDSDIPMKSILIESLLRNEIYLSEEMASFLNEQISFLFNYNEKYMIEEDYQTIIKLFEFLVSNVYEILKGPNEDLKNQTKHFIPSIELYTDLYIFKKREKRLNIEYIFPFFNKLCFDLNFFDKKDLIESLFCYLYSLSFLTIDLVDGDEAANSTSEDIFTQNLELQNQKKYKNLFYENIDIIFSETVPKVFKKEILEVIFPFLIKRKNYDVPINLEEEEISKSDIFTIFTKIDSIFEIMMEYKILLFFEMFFNNFNFRKFFLNYKSNKYYHLLRKIFIAMEKAVKFIYQNFNLKFESYFSKIVDFCKEFLGSTTCFELNKQITRVIVRIVKFSAQRDDYLTYMRRTFLASTSFYSRRIYVLFVELAYQSYSPEFLKNWKITKDVNYTLLKDIDIIKEKIIQIANSEKEVSEAELEEEKKIMENEEKSLELIKKVEDIFKPPSRYGKKTFKQNSLTSSSKKVPSSSQNVSTVLNIKSKIPKIDKPRIKKSETLLNEHFMNRVTKKRLSDNVIHNFSYTQGNNVKNGK